MLTRAMDRGETKNEMCTRLGEYGYRNKTWWSQFPKSVLQVVSGELEEFPGDRRGDPYPGCACRYCDEERSRRAGDTDSDTPAYVGTAPVPEEVRKSIRFAPDLLEQIEDNRASVESFSDAVRRLIEQGLE